MTQRTQSARKWRMWARVVRFNSTSWTPELSFYRQRFNGLTPHSHQIIRVEIRELRGKKRRK